MRRASFGCPTLTSKPGSGPTVWSNCTNAAAMGGESHCWPNQWPYGVTATAASSGMPGTSPVTTEPRLPMRWEPRRAARVRGPVHAAALAGPLRPEPLQLSVRLQADSPWLELIITAQWRQLHELLRCEWALNHPGHFWCATHQAACRRSSALEPQGSRPAGKPPPSAGCGRQQPSGISGAARWPARGQRQAAKAGGVVIKGPTWPDPSADQGWHRLRLALMPTTGGWHRAAVAAQAAASANRSGAIQRPRSSGGEDLAGWPDPHQQWLVWARQ